MYSEDRPLEDQEPLPDLSENPLLVEQEETRRRQLEEYYRRRRNSMIRWAILLAVLLFASVLACYYVFGPESIMGFLEEYWPVLVSPMIGWILGRWAVKVLYRPSGRVVVCLDPENHTFRAVFIPDSMFRFFEQSGNNVLYHSPLGMPVYVAEYMDTDSGEIRYSWVHELDSMSVMTREETYVNWRTTLEEVLRENLQIMDHPHVIALGYTRKTLRDHLDMLADMLGIDGRDFSRDTSVSEPFPDEDEEGRR